MSNSSKASLIGICSTAACKDSTILINCSNEISFFDDYSITEVIAQSHVTQKWEDKFALADRCKAEFLELAICVKVRKIIRESSVNGYDKNTKP